jgi:hypothetical protein
MGGTKNAMQPSGSSSTSENGQAGCDSSQPDEKFCALLIKVLNALCSIPSVMSGDSVNQGQIVSTLVGEVYGTSMDATKIAKHLIRQKNPRPRSEEDSTSGSESGTEPSPTSSGAGQNAKAKSQDQAWNKKRSKKKKGGNQIS